MKNNTKKTLKIYLKHCLKYKVSFFVISLAVVLASAISTIWPLFLKKFFDILSQSDSYLNVGLVAGELLRIIFYILLLDLSGWLCWRVAGFTMIYFQPHVIADLTNTCFAYLHKHSYGFFEKSFVGSLTKRVKWFSRAFETIHDKFTWNILPLAVNIIFISIILFKRNVWLGLAVVSWLAIFLTGNWFFIKFKIKYDIKKAEKETQATGLLADTITNAHTIQLFTGYARETKKFKEITEELRKIQKFTWSLSAFLEAGQGILMVGLEFAVFYLAIWLWQKSILTVGDFVLLQAYLFNIFMRVWDFGKILRGFYENLADAEEMTVILNTPHEIVDVIKAKNLRVTDGAIEFENIDFYYHQTRPVLKNFNLSVKSHERIALIGPSGAGKTTIVKLLLRIRETTSGEILIDKQNIAKVKQESLRENISLVPQDPILFHRTLIENIRYGNPKASDKEVIEASKKALCHDFIMALPENYNTYVGERGIKLSGGERQRVAIARAILRNSRILLLDEATSSLDSASEKMIQEAMNTLMENKTVIVIAHRLSTIRKMDRIVVVEDGRIAQEGGHQTLLQQEGGIYKKLWTLQAGGFIN